MTLKSVNAPCPCGQSRKYKHCCGVYHRGTPAPDALSLMRSRYSAYAIGQVDYIMQTTDPGCPEFDTDRARWAARIAQFSRDTQFVALHIVQANSTQVVFKATLLQDGRDVSFCEVSDFVQREGQWLYRHGSPSPKPQRPKL